MTTTAADVLRIEAAALGAAADRLDETVVQRAVALLAAARSVHVTGIGKSGDIARKAAATLTSTGTPATFLHPADALHGGLGIVSYGDVVIALSNSGETEEVLSLLPYLAARDVPVVAVVGGKGSTLARRAAVVFDASVETEACPLGLAPTTSTTLALALTDAVAVALMQAKGVTSTAFASNHPSGRLGRRLTLRVADLMVERAMVVDVEPDHSLVDVVTAIGKGGLGAAPVVDRGVVVGIVTDGDIRRALERMAPTALTTLRVEDLMTAGPVTTRPDALAYAALREMEERPSQITVLPVVDDAQALVGMLRLHDLVRAGL